MTSITNWINDFTIGFAQFPGTKSSVHPGFLKVYQGHYAFLFPAIPKLLQLYPDYDLVATGHSLGGSSATMFALQLYKYYGIDKTKLVTFGSPRIGNADFRNEFIQSGIRNWRVTNMNDIVPHLPLPIQGYIHIPNEIFQSKVNGAKDFKICKDRKEEDPTCAASRTIISIDDHEHYMGVFSGKCSLIPRLLK
jgi:predicted lipase